MNLFEIFNGLNKTTIAEGGNVSSQSPGWQGAPDQEAEEIDLKIHDRDFMVGQLRTLLAAQNESFKAAYGKYIWEPKLLKSGQMFSGSSLTFFDIKGVSTQDFLNKLKKNKVGDIDTQIDQDMGEEVTAWLKSIIGKKVGNGTFIGFNSSLSSIWLLDDPQVRVQIDYELGPYDPKTKSPTEWFAYSHSSHYDDMAAGIKGVFHKYINRALTHAQATTKYVARVLKKGVKISDEPVTDSDYSFAVSSSQGGGMSIKYKPYIDPATGQPMEKDGIPVMQQLDPKDRDYIQNLDQQFQMTYGRKRTAADQKLQGSFVGTIQLMNKAFTPEQNEAVVRAFLDILFGRGSQMITKDDPARDRDIKFAAVDAMLLGGGGITPLNLPNGKALRQEAVKMAMDYADVYTAKRAGKAESLDTEVAEDTEAAAAAKPNYARQGIKHLYNRLPDGRISSVEMKDAEFLEVAKEIADNGGTLDGFPINLKVDGAGIRFGKDESGRPFFMTSKVTQPLYQDDVGYFTSFGQQRGQDPEQLARTKKYDDALALITGSKFIQTLPPDTIVQAEMLYNPMAEKTDQGLKFVNISYDPSKLGGQMTLVPFMFKQYSTGEERPDADKIKKRLLAAGDKNIKIISNGLDQKGINVSKIINPILGLDPKDKNNKPAFDKAKQELSTAIIDNPKLGGKDALGSNMEGIVVNMPSGKLFKVTSQQMKSAMAAKMSQPGAKRQGPEKTAVVAIGSFVGHKGHQELFKYTIDKAKEVGGDPFLFMGNAVGVDDPIPVEDKIKTWKQLYPSYANNISATMEGGSLMQKIKHELINPLPGKPPKYDNVIIMVGEDQAGMNIANALMKAVTKFPGYEHVKVTLEATPRGTGMSFTKLRNALKTSDEQTALSMWTDAFNGGSSGAKPLPPQWIKHLMDVSRTGMKIQKQPAAPQTVQQPALAEMRLFNALILNEDWQSVNQKDKTDGMSSKAVKAYRRENPGSKLKTAVTKKPSELKAGSKDAKRRKSFCARMSGNKGPMKDEKGRPTPKAKALARWNCESVEEMKNLIALAEQKILEMKSESMLPANSFVGADKNKLGTAGQLKGKTKRPAKAGDLVGEQSLEEYGDTNPHTSALGKALYRDLSKEKKASPAQVQRNKERWAKRQAEREQGTAEGYDKWGWHTSVKNGEFMPTKYGNKAYVYLHDMDNQSANGNPQLVTVNKPTVAKRIAQQFGGKVVKTDLNTYRIVKPADQSVEEVSKDTIDRYVSKAVDSHGHADFAARMSKDDPTKRSYHKDQKHTAEKRRQGISRALDRMSREGVAEGDSPAMAQTAKRLTDPKDGAVAKLRAAGDKRREDHLKSRDVSKKNEAIIPVGETDKKKGADGKACWKGYKYAGTKNGKDKCVPIGESWDVEMAKAILKLTEGKI